MSKRTERRLLSPAELRVGEGEESGKLVGHAAVFNQWTRISEPWFGDLYEEQVAPGAFRKTLKEADIRALWNHDPNIILGRNKAGTLELREDDTGLETTITPPDNEWGRPVLDAVRRGDVTGMSIAFRVVKETWETPDKQTDPKALRKRTIKEARLLDVSPVTYPAYAQTDIAARSEGEADDSQLVAAFRAARLAEMGLPLGDGERDAVRRAAEYMLGVSGEPVVAEDKTPDHSPVAQSNEPVADVDHSEAARARRLELIRMQMEVTP